MRYSFIAAVLFTPTIIVGYPVAKNGPVLTPDTIAPPHLLYNPTGPPTVETHREHAQMMENEMRRMMSHPMTEKELGKVHAQRDLRLVTPKEEIIVHPYRPFAEYTGVGKVHDGHGEAIIKGRDTETPVSQEEHQGSLPPKPEPIAGGDIERPPHPNEHHLKPLIGARDDSVELEEADVVDLPILSDYYPDSSEIEELYHEMSIPVSPSDRHAHRPIRLASEAPSSSSASTKATGTVDESADLKSRDLGFGGSDMIDTIVKLGGGETPNDKPASQTPPIDVIAMPGPEINIMPEAPDPNVEVKTPELADPASFNLIPQEQATGLPELVQALEKDLEEQPQATAPPPLIESVEKGKENAKDKAARKKADKEKAAKERADREKAAVDQIAREEAAKAEEDKIKEAEEQAFREKMERKKARDRYARRKEAWEKWVLERQKKEREYKKTHPRPKASGKNPQKEPDPGLPALVGIDPVPDIMEYAPDLFDYLPEPFPEKPPFEEDREWSEELFRELTKPRHPLSWIQSDVDSLNPITEEPVYDEEPVDRKPTDEELAATTGFTQGDGWKTDFWQNGLWGQPRVPKAYEPYWSEGSPVYKRDDRLDNSE